MEHVAILGASNNSSRYSYKAQNKLVENGHVVYPVSLKEQEVLGVKSYSSLKEIDQTIDTITVYINPTHFHKVVNDIVTLKPQRVIFNPGSESPAEMKVLEEAGISTEAACTLVLLATNQFED
jgi:predicted CoA-binding protein